MKRWNLERFAAFFAEMKLKDVPLDVQEKAKLCLLDVLECCARASGEDSRLKGALASINGRVDLGGATLWGEAKSTSPGDAAFVNAVRGSLSYRNDLHRKSAIHAGAIVCATALAAAEESGASPEQALLGIIAGYESMIRLGEVFAVKGLPRGFRSTAVCAPFGAAIAAAKTQGLSEKEMLSAASFSCHSGAGNNEWACAGTGEDVFQAGWGARNGLWAASLAAAGACGCASNLEGENGMLVCFHALDGLPLLTEALGEDYKILKVEHKPIEACLMLQAPCQAAQKIAQETDFSPEEVGEIEIIVAAQAKHQPGCDMSDAENSVQAKMSLRYGVAQALVRQKWLWDPPDETLRRLMQCCVVRESSDFTSLFPQKTAASVRVVAAGHIYEAHMEDFLPLKSDEVESKYHQACGSWLGQERESLIFQAVKQFERLAHIAQLTELLKK